jgi:hypothetical protein
LVILKSQRSWKTRISKRKKLKRWQVHRRRPSMLMSLRRSPNLRVRLTINRTKMEQSQKMKKQRRRRKRTTAPTTKERNAAMAMRKMQKNQKIAQASTMQKKSAAIATRRKPQQMKRIQ